MSSQEAEELFPELAPLTKAQSNYFEALRAWWGALEGHGLSHGGFRLGMAILHCWNEAGRPKWVAIRQEELLALAEVKVRSFLEWRKELVEMGLIAYEAGASALQPARYGLGPAVRRWRPEERSREQQQCKKSSAKRAVQKEQCTERTANSAKNALVNSAPFAPPNNKKSTKEEEYPSPISQVDFSSPATGTMESKIVDLPAVDRARARVNRMVGYPAASAFRYDEDQALRVALAWPEEDWMLLETFMLAPEVENERDKDDPRRYRVLHNRARFLERLEEHRSKALKWKGMGRPGLRQAEVRLKKAEGPAAAPGEGWEGVALRAFELDSWPGEDVPAWGDLTVEQRGQVWARWRREARPVEDPAGVAAVSPEPVMDEAAWEAGRQSLAAWKQQRKGGAA